MLILFVGVMFGVVQIAQGGSVKGRRHARRQGGKETTAESTHHRGHLSDREKVAGYLGVTMTKKLFASGVAKAIPVGGAVLSGGLTPGTFLPMSNWLQKHLASLELTKPGHRSEGAEIMTQKSSI